ncbi:metallophosphoesterase [Pedobacter punctiformis]|uniref:Metallophosphoesterase n=1 Tax=Pedobacter punctiformis TaxID=3004097 RepID=A0ABT4L6R8_9SPHI|nr:metallophosphoesterase [Pedobacter sp. HCMS5-2]MCZ4243613.1 metallophosphoesterase [Pedobacter sp. HCMS5-2]
MRKFLQRLLGNWVIRMSNKFGSRPNLKRIHSALSLLYKTINKEPGNRGPVFEFTSESKFIIFSDQHKGARNYADDFAVCEQNYLKALEHYNSAQFNYINLGDSEELWENLLEPVIKHNKQTFECEKAFIARDAFTKIFGNHDLYWDNDPLSGFNLSRIYGKKIPIYEGAILRTTINEKVLDVFLTHGHQGDLQSDGNWFSKWFVSTIWAPFQSYLQINPNTPAYDNQLKTTHNTLMYKWVAEHKNIALITGHTHQPVFSSLTHLERIYVALRKARKENDKTKLDELNEELGKRIREGDKAPAFRKYKPNYFNSGCCCFSDGDITGIEIESGKIRLIKWSCKNSGKPERIMLEEMALADLTES